MATKGIGRPLTILLKADTSGLGKGLQDAQTKLKKFGGQLEQLSRQATIVFAGVAAAGYKVVQSASDLNESISKSNVIFGSSAKAIQGWAATADQALGLSQTAALEAAGNFAILGQSAGLTGVQLNTFSTDLTGLAADLASFNNTTTDEAITALAAGLRGESEPLRRFGVLLSESAVQAKAMEMGLAATAKELTDQDKVLARNALILEQTTLQQGDFARTADGAANQQRILAAEIENSRAAIGEGLLPAYRDLLGVLVNVADWAGKNSDLVRNLAITIGTLSSAVISLNVAFKIATFSVQTFTAVASALRLVQLTLAASTGSLVAAQILAELTYKNSRSAAILYSIAMAAQNAITLGLVGSVRALTVALLANPFTAVAAAAAILVGILYKLYQNTKAVREESEAVAGAIAATRKETEDDVLSAKRHVKARIGQTKATNDLTDATNTGTAASKKAAEAAKKQAEAEAALQKAANERLQSFQSRLQDVQGQLESTRQAQQNYAQSVKDSITSLLNFQTAFTDKGEGSFIDSLRKQAEAAKLFGGQITDLLGRGLNRSSIDRILAVGAEVGSQIATEILAGGESTITEINDLVAAVEGSAESLAAATSAKWYDAGLAQGQAMVNGIIAAAAAVGLAFVDGQLVIPAAITATATVTEAPAKKAKKKPKKKATGGPVFASQTYLVGENGPELFTGQTGNITRNSALGGVNITINGAIDPEGVRRQLERLFQQSGRRTQQVNFIGASL
ncbi:hypothetical protein UFOVP481_24 [uncultured Caudovirales phage]|uniref:Uncharacterized protein n=1 Tax=uncultured Caudovirales phage TaxID=2100421 RepID=A0A6J5MQA9_9CAUD|nr:hypothetical protein UFOVP481_24 [uncultured Caudovirales phage]CAB4190896.1 hypothetical protein UFOVP1210_2 [uncultured Caudovirales phage]